MAIFALLLIAFIGPFIDYPNSDDDDDGGNVGGGGDNVEGGGDNVDGNVEGGDGGNDDDAGREAIGLMHLNDNVDGGGVNVDGGGVNVDGGGVNVDGKVEGGDGGDDDAGREAIGLKHLNDNVDGGGVKVDGKVEGGDGGDDDAGREAIGLMNVDHQSPRENSPLREFDCYIADACDGCGMWPISGNTYRYSDLGVDFNLCASCHRSAPKGMYKKVTSRKGR